MDTKTALLDSAETIARQRGFDGFSYADLSAAVGIRKASIHHHFPTKAILGQAMMERYRISFDDALSEVKRGTNSAADRLRGYVGLYQDALQGGKTICLCVALSSDRNSLDDATLNEISRFHAMSLAWLETLFDDAKSDGSIKNVTDSKLEAAQCLALVEGAQLMAHAQQDVDVFISATALLLARVSA
ncbi:TetR/AcrR family transcriptional regulator [Thalassospira sp. GO-4]|jgi:TetR/AcrR family transcriptional repressor of nem operon|uniref:TetR/AcrR family transcriptional regulator n=1 Tax=unclassified Thalassospira TaxID=2648997 RepID=UPI000DEDBF44|nr:MULTISPECIES: TetR/AcrR family transcriptional regulator [unclassified Thalassospira]MBO6772873.1 TetR/AcrR family transcriptional regulator [Thalassospira sp.]RCK23682.1 hypothetical protein TH8_14905 [Thalassospira profundimaris]URK19103.1 TetR/AcrR family transcriptional regulator [Thalassospira sp. GO-4]